MEAKLTIQERLKDLRVVDRGLSLEQLAEQTGLSKSALGKYESEDFKDISPFAIVTLGKVLRCVYRLSAGADRKQKSRKCRASDRKSVV